MIDFRANHDVISPVPDLRLHKKVMRDLMAEMLDAPVSDQPIVLREVELAERFDVSRGVIRETLRGLEERGVVSVRHGRGATVQASEPWDVLDLDVLAVLLGSEHAGDLLVELNECRRILEVEAAAEAAERATEDDIEALWAAAARTETTAVESRAGRAGESRFLEADIEFHRLVTASAHNRVLSRMMASIQRPLATTRATGTDPRSRPTRVVEHAKIVAAIAARDSDAARATMHEHLAGVESTLLARLDGGHRDGARASRGH